MDECSKNNHKLVLCDNPNCLRFSNGEMKLKSCLVYGMGIPTSIYIHIYYRSQVVRDPIQSVPPNVKYNVFSLLLININCSHYSVGFLEHFNFGRYFIELQYQNRFAKLNTFNLAHHFLYDYFG